VNYEVRALQISFAVHISAIILFITANSFFAAEKRLPVIDFTLVDSVQSTGIENRPVAAGRKLVHKRLKKETIRQNPGTAYSKPEAETFRRNPDITKPVPEKLPQVSHDIRAISKPDVRVQVPSYSGKGTGLADKDIPDISGITPAYDILSGGWVEQTASFGYPQNAHDTKKMTYMKANFSYIRDMINRKLVYPLMARQKGWEGKVKVSFIIAQDGFVRDIIITESSGAELLDKSAINAVKNASPFPRPPVAAQIIIPIKYKLR
jgi:periplasmic protein TonB